MSKDIVPEDDFQTSLRCKCGGIVILDGIDLICPKCKMSAINISAGLNFFNELTFISDSKNTYYIEDGREFIALDSDGKIASKL